MKKNKKKLQRPDNWILITVFTVSALIILLLLLQNILPPKNYPLRSECANRTIPKLIGQFNIDIKDKTVIISNITDYSTDYENNDTYVDCAKNLCSVYIDEIGVRCETAGGGGE
jgi:predicted adenine nucleotide alpha hydrolase (AANH) superfamily ATPase